MCLHFTTSNQALINSAPAKNVSGTNFSNTDSLKVPLHGFKIGAELKVQLSYNFFPLRVSFIKNSWYCGYNLLNLNLPSSILVQL